jgi:Holliday junction resolvase-like predicted endonuclease
MSKPTMTVEEAREVVWPFREIKGQKMGALLDQKLLRLQDLAYALENAYLYQVREAARTLLIHHLTDAPPVTSLAHIIKGKTYSFTERRQVQWTLFIGMVLGIWLGLSVLSFFVGSLGTFAPIIFLVSLVFSFLVINWLAEHYIKKMKAYRQGQRGEEQVLNALAGALDGAWTILCNLELKGHGDIDLILVSPWGVWCLEVKNYQGHYRLHGETWNYQKKERWHKLSYDPSRQVKRNAAKVSQLLAAQGFKQWVKPVIVWANVESKLFQQNPLIEVWRLEEIYPKLENIKTQAPVLSPEQCEKMSKGLQALYLQITPDTTKE